jgi:hypothetical protein
MKAYGVMDIQIHIFFFTSALPGDEWLASWPGCFIPPGEISPGTRWIEVWVDPKAGLDDVE